MKNSVKFLAIAALTLFAASSCSKEQAVATAEGEETLVSFTIASPVISTKAIADGNTVDKVDVKVYNASGLITDNTISKTVDMAGGKATYTARLVTGQTYQFVFWAYNEAGQHYTLDATTKKVTVNYEGFNNDESRDAFYKYIEAKKITGPIKETILLNRPFAQLNFGVNEADIAAAAAAGIAVKKSAVKVVGVPNVLDLTDGSADGDVTVTYTLADCPAEKLAVKNVEYGYVSMGYILAGKDEKITAEASLTIADEAGADLCEPKVVPAVPLQGNWRTNILGNLFTSDVEFNIVVDPIFTDDNDIDLENISTEAALKALFINGGSAKLVEDFAINQPLTLSGKNFVNLDLNGHNLINNNTPFVDGSDNDYGIFIVKDDATLNISGEGEVKSICADPELGPSGVWCMNVWAKDNATVNIHGGSFYNSMVKEGQLDLIYANGNAQVNIYGGRFESANHTVREGKDVYWVLNLRDNAPAKINVFGGEFVKFNPAATNTEPTDNNFVAEGYASVQDGDVFTVVKGAAGTIVSNAVELDAAIANATGDETIYLKEGTYTNVIDVRTDNALTFKPLNGGEVVIAGVNATSNGRDFKCSFEDITFDNSIQTAGWYIGTATNINPCVGAWGGDLSFNKCKFIVAGTSKKETGIMTWWTTSAYPCKLTFEGCTFEGLNNHSEARAMQIYGHVDLLVEDCTFTTAKRYAIKYAANEGFTATFRNNNVSNCNYIVELGSSDYPGSKYTVNFENNTLAEGVADYKIAHEEGAVINIAE